jgi:hypothetical protein
MRAPKATVEHVLHAFPAARAPPQLLTSAPVPWEGGREGGRRNASPVQRFGGRQPQMSLSMSANANRTVMGRGRLKSNRRRSKSTSDPCCAMSGPSTDLRAAWSRCVAVWCALARRRFSASTDALTWRAAHGPNPKPSPLNPKPGAPHTCTGCAARAVWAHRPSFLGGAEQVNGEPRGSY